MNQSNENFSRSDIFRAYTDCIRRKKSSLDYTRFVLSGGELEIFDLLSEIHNETYKVGASTCFVVKKPKPREVFAGAFRDRIVHHLIVNELEPYFEQRFVPTVFSCRVGKGPLKAIQTLRRDCMHDRTPDLHFLQMDIASFFMSIDKQTLSAIFDREFRRNSFAKEESLRFLLDTIIFDDPTEQSICKGKESDFSLIHPTKTLFGRTGGQGLPIGNLTSQFFANVYLNELDQFVKRTLRVKRYYRYVDDFILLGTRAELQRHQTAITEFLSSRLKLRVAEQKTKLLPVSYGIDFVGYILKNSSDILPRRRNIHNFRRAVEKYTPTSLREVRTFQSSVNSYCGILRHAKTYRLRRSTLSTISTEYFKVSSDASKIILRTNSKILK